MQKSPLKEKSYALALQVIACSRQLRVQKEFVLSDQLMRSGTSIGANIEEAIEAQSRKDFISKLSIALKEAKEAHYWLKLISASTPQSNAKALLPLTHEVISMLVSSIKTTRG